MAYGVGKAGCDRMAADCAFELRKSGVAMISLWPGPVKTEYITDKMDDTNPMSKVFAKGESIEFSGMVCAHLAAEASVMERSGKIINTADVARQYGITDIDGTVPLDFRWGIYNMFGDDMDIRHTLKNIKMTQLQFKNHLFNDCCLDKLTPWLLSEAGLVLQLGYQTFCACPCG